MRSDGLTKGGQKNLELMRVLQTGTYELPGGWTIKKHHGVFSRTWFDLKGQSEREKQLLQISLNLTKSRWDDAARGRSF